MKTVILTSNTSWYLWNFRKSTIQAFFDKGYQVACIAPRDEFTQKLTELGVDFYEIPLEGSGTSVFGELKSFLVIIKLVKQLNPDFVFNFTIKMNVYVGLACRLLKTPYANNVSGLGTAFLHSGFVYKFAQKIYGLSNKCAQTVFFQNNEDMQTFFDLRLASSERSVLLPGSGVDLKRFSLTELPELTPFVFIMVGRLIADKGVREYVAAAKRLKGIYPSTRFLLLGPSGISNKSAIESEELNRWQAEGDVEYIGEQRDVVPWLAKAHVLVLPSYREGMPKTVLEAAGMGRPAIVSDVPGCRQSIKEGETGWLCKVADVVSLYDVMQLVLELDSIELTKFSKAARLHAELHFSEQIVIEQYLKCLESL